ncbi:MAG: universal stress protein [Hyphomicrobiales bacterium]
MGVRILLGISGGTENRSKRELTFSIAKKTGSAISALAIQDIERLKQLDQKTLGVYSHQVKKVEKRLERAENLVEARLTKLEEKAKAKKIDLTTISAEGDMLEAGMDEWRFHDLLVLGTHPWMIGVDQPEDSSLILKLISSGVRPVLAVPRGAPSSASKVLVALSGSLDSAKAMKHLVQLGIFPGATMHLVTVGKPKSGEEPEELLNKAAGYCKVHGLKVTTAALEGVGSEAVLEETDRVEADVICIGSSFKRVLFTERFGTHALNIIDKSPVAVFISH